MSRTAINDLMFSEPRAFKDFTYQTNSGKAVTVRLYAPSVRDKGWLMSLRKFEDAPQELFVEVLMRADIRDPESNERLFDSTMKDMIANSDQDFLVRMAGDWISLANSETREEAIKN